MKLIDSDEFLQDTADLYIETCRRICRGRSRRMTDAEIIKELAEEIIFYRDKIMAMEKQITALKAQLVEKEEHSLEHMRPQGTE